jgi:hypothetical protein
MANLRRVWTGDDLTGLVRVASEVISWGGDGCLAVTEGKAKSVPCWSANLPDPDSLKDDVMLGGDGMVRSESNSLQQ